ncbi:MAG TPA: hypothetical protein DCR93_01605 [Cytophagales bacterium]|nr:hypothetical protein [Cytophagales bacterium]HAP58248.1 hypothetical protein [Cytophagales bacterium]
MSFLTFRSYPTQVQAEEVGVLLRQQDIPFKINSTDDTFDPTFSFNRAATQWELKIPQDHFDRANFLMEQEALNTPLPKEHFLRGFSEKELIEVLTKPDEWSEQDFVWARLLLADQGKVMSDEALKRLKDQRLAVLRTPEAGSPFWTFAAYLAALAGGIVGIGIGYSLWMGKKTLPNGERVWRYRLQDRRHGLRIFVLGAFVATITAVVSLVAL